MQKIPSKLFPQKLVVFFLWWLRSVCLLWSCLGHTDQRGKNRLCTDPGKLLRTRGPDWAGLQDFPQTHPAVCCAKPLLLIHSACCWYRWLTDHLPYFFGTQQLTPTVTLLWPTQYSAILGSWTVDLLRGGSCHQSTCCILPKPGTCRGTMKALHSLMWLITLVLVEWICNLQKCHEMTSKNCLNLCDLVRIWIQSSRGKSHRALCEVPDSHISVYNFFFSPFKRKRLGFEKVVQEPKGYWATVLSLQPLQQLHLLLLLSCLKTFPSFKVFGNSLQKNKVLNSSIKISLTMVGYQT